MSPRRCVLRFHGDFTVYRVVGEEPETWVGCVSGGHRAADLGQPLPLRTVWHRPLDAGASERGGKRCLGIDCMMLGLLTGGGDVRERTCDRLAHPRRIC